MLVQRQATAGRGPDGWASPLPLRHVVASWEVLVAPEPDPIGEHLLRIASMLRALGRWGFEPILCDLPHYSPFGHSYH